MLSNALFIMLLTVSSYWYQQVISVKNRATLIVAVL